MIDFKAYALSALTGIIVKTQKDDWTWYGVRSLSRENERNKSMLMQISHNDFDGMNYIQVIESGCVVLEVPLIKEQENE